MKTVTNAYKALLAARVQRRAKLWRVRLLSGEYRYYTDDSRPIRYAGQVYSSNPGIQISAVRNGLDSTTQTATITFAFSDNGITKAQLRNGDLDNAQFEVVQVHADELSAGSMYVFGGYVDDFSFDDYQAELNLTGYSSRRGGSMIGEQYSQRCRNIFGDARCTVDVDSFAEIGTVTAENVGQQKFSSIGTLPHEPGYWSFGSVKWLTGGNTGRVFDVADVSPEGVITQGTAAPYPIYPGDTFLMRPGCSLFREECSARWGNLLHFRGEPDVPNLTAGIDEQEQSRPPSREYIIGADGRPINFRPGALAPADTSPNGAIPVYYTG